MITYAYGSIVDFTDGMGSTHTGRIYATWQSRDTELGYLIMPCNVSLDTRPYMVEADCVRPHEQEIP